ncbi:MAG: EAL domain-containing protein [Gammaproteobacteria bacterium]|nr:EAL domain-containing protein [Gammaproteobacteria bacterium]
MDAHRMDLSPAAPDPEAERVSLLYRQATPTLVMSFGIAALLGAVLWYETHPTWLMAWISAVVVVTLLRIVVTLAFRRSHSPEPKRWERIYTLGAVIGGSTWGLAGWLPEYTPSLVHQLFIVLTLAGITAATIVSTGASYRAYLSFLIPALMPLTVWEIQSDQYASISVAVLVALFGSTLALTAFSYHRNLLQSLRMRRENILLDAEIRLTARVFDDTLQGTLITDVDGRITKINPAATAITGYSVAEATGTPLRRWLSDQNAAAFHDAVMATVRTTEKWEGEAWYRRKNGEAFPVWQTITTVHDRHGTAVGRIVVFGDISERKREEDQIRRIAYQDPLTKLPNRRVFEDRLDHAVKRTKRRGARFAILFVDLYHFRAINDSLGYHAGDQLLRTVAQRLQNRVRTEDTVARLEGDKFGLILEDIAAPGDAETVAQDVIALLNAPLALADETLIPASCIGIGVYPEDGLDVETLIENVDTALNLATKQSENSYKRYSTTMTRAASERLSMEWALRRAIEHDELVLHYQPFYSLKRGAVVGMEALVRWQHPERGLVPPNLFIPLAEETRLILPLSRWVMHRAACDWHELNNGHVPPLQLSVNISAQQLAQPDFVSTIAEVLQSSGMPPAQLKVEITESVLVADPDSAATVLQNLKALGVHIAIDDFGTGYSSLSYLANLPIDTIKIDRAFIRNLDTNTANAAMVQAILQMSQALKLDVVAEGIETEAEASMLRSLGGDIFQGYLFCRPVPKESFAEKTGGGSSYYGDVPKVVRRS